MKKLALILLLAGTLIPFLSQAQQSYKIKSHNLIISGTSNLHDWTATAEKASGMFNIKFNEKKMASVNAFELKVDANSLKGSKGSIMNSKIIDALKAKKNPYITFKSTGGNLNEKSGVYKISVNGILTIAGKSQNVIVEAQGKMLPNGDIEFSGARKLKMTDYNIDPPTAMLGTLTTGDEVTLNFKLTLKSDESTAQNN
jgi:polyisoprenoid-binding protein YceI